jgi:hypothetical protein
MKGWPEKFPETKRRDETCCLLKRCAFHPLEELPLQRPGYADSLRRMNLEHVKGLIDIL